MIPTIISLYDIKSDIEALKILPLDAVVTDDLFIVPADEIVNASVTLNEGESSINHLPVMMQERIYNSIQERVISLGCTVRASGEAVFEMEDGRKILYIAVRTARLH